MLREDALGRVQREIREVLVVDRVELIAFDQPRQMRKLEGDRSVPGEHQADATHEIVEVGYLCQDVVADDQVGAAALLRESRRGFDPKELDQGGDPLLLGYACD